MTSFLPFTGFGPEYRKKEGRLAASQYVFLKKCDFCNDQFINLLSVMRINEVFAVEMFSGNNMTEDAFQRTFNKILLVEKGKGRLVVDDVPCTIADHSIYLIKKDIPVNFDAFTITGFLMQFDESFWRKTPVSANNCKEVLFNHDAGSYSMPASSASFNHLHELFHLVWRDFTAPDYSNKPDALAAFLKVIVIKLANIHFLLQPGTSSYDSKLFQQFISLIHEQGSRLHKVDDFAARLGVSTRKLSAVCKDKGQNAKTMILQHLIDEAKKDLQFTTRSIKEIAIELNFSTPYQFSNFFKSKTGYSPNEYRNQFVKIGI
jgi:AraC family transcriptional activator of pobA